jgi:hypothetical protein
MTGKFIVRTACLAAALAFPQASPLAAATLARDVYGCPTPAMLDQLENRIAQGDKGAFEQLTGRGCVPLSKGQSVTLGKTVRSAVCVKRRGQPRCLWTSKDAVVR